MTEHDELLSSDDVKRVSDALARLPELLQAERDLKRLRADATQPELYELRRLRATIAERDTKIAALEQRDRTRRIAELDEAANLNERIATLERELVELSALTTKVLTGAKLTTEAYDDVLPKVIAACSKAIR